MATKDLGRVGEEIAAQYLTNLGAEIVARNYTVRGGEIDLIAELGGMLHFVEVKLRTTTAFGRGAEAVTLTKQRLICRTALCYLKEHHALDRICRFDVIEVCPPDIRYIPRAFEYVR